MEARHDSKSFNITEAGSVLTQELQRWTMLVYKPDSNHGLIPGEEDADAIRDLHQLQPTGTGDMP